MSLLFLALLQLAFTLCWTVYVLFLPDLAAQAGISKSWIVMILMADQVIFAIMDWALGANADRVAENMKRFGLWIAAVCAISTLAFVMLPHIAPATSAGVFIALIVVWSLSASILRAPPLVLLSRHADLSARPAIAAALAFGLGVAGALAPYVTLNLKGVDPRAPFLLAGLATLIATLTLVGLPRPAVSSATPAAIKTDPPQVPPFLIAGLLLAIGFQIHVAMNAAPRYLAFMKSPELVWWMPVFWIGFSLAVFPVSMCLKRTQPQRAIVTGAAVGAFALLFAPHMPALGLLAACEFAAGCGWAMCFLGLVQAALTLGATGHEGSIAGRLFALFAVAIFLRLGVTLSGVALDAAARGVLQFTAAAMWTAAALILWRSFSMRGN